jgi:hypothetical protein
MMILSFFILLHTQGTFALEAMNPISLCERMINEKSLKECQSKAETLNLDWYAATACNAVDDNNNFIKCWKNISGAQFNPDSLARCVENPDDKDDSVMNCIAALKNNRGPASLREPFQSLSGKRHKGVR